MTHINQNSDEFDRSAADIKKALRQANLKIYSSLSENDPRNHAQGIVAQQEAVIIATMRKLPHKLVELQSLSSSTRRLLDNATIAFHLFQLKEQLNLLNLKSPKFDALNLLYTNLFYATKKHMNGVISTKVYQEKASEYIKESKNSILNTHEGIKPILLNLLTVITALCTAGISLGITYLLTKNAFFSLGDTQPIKTANSILQTVSNSDYSDVVLKCDLDDLSIPPKPPR